MSYYNKYFKYKNKYIDLKNKISQRGGSDTENLSNRAGTDGGGGGGTRTESGDLQDNYIICLLWYNKQKIPIHQRSPKTGEDLHIKDNILKTYNMYKIKYENKNVVLFLNFDKITKEDFDFFNNNKIVTENINEFEVFKDTKLNSIFNPKRKSLDPEDDPLPCHTYVCVDMLKILIQYEQMVTKKYDIVIFSDLDIKDDIEYDSITEATDLICKVPSLINKFRQQDLLDPKTIDLLNSFGYLVAGWTEYHNIPETGKKSYDENPDNFPNIVTINGGKKLLIHGSENSFLISKNTPNVIKAIKDYFIDHLFLYRISRSPYNYDNNFIYESYPAFYKYLNFLNKIIYLNGIITSYNYKTSLLENFIIDIDYNIVAELSEDLPDSKKIKIIKIIKILSDKLFFHLHRNFTDVDYQSFLTEHGKNVLDKFQYEISPIIQKSKYDEPINSQLMPFKCVPISKQKNSK